jgi:hypothetical protein
MILDTLLSTESEGRAPCGFRSAVIRGDEQSAEGISNFYGAGMKIGGSRRAPFMRPRRRFSSRQRISIAEVDAPRRCAT